MISTFVAAAAIGALCVRGWRGHPGGFGALAVAAMLVMLLFASGASSDLSAPQLDTSLPVWLCRWTVAASYAVLVPAAVAALFAGRWYARTRPALATPKSAPADAGRPSSQRWFDAR